MREIDTKDITQYVEQNIGIFHQRRIQSLGNLKLYQVLKRKNPYLFKAKYILTAEQIVRVLVDAHISSNEETIFGDWLEGLVIYINNKAYDGWKSGIKGIDLEFDKDKIRYIVTIKSGPNWGNSSQIIKMVTDFRMAKKTLRTSNSQINVVAINGCCYGRDNRPDKGDYYKYCGQRFWEFISGDPEFFIKIVEPLGYNARVKNHDFIESYSQMLNKFTKEFVNEFCSDNGTISWNRLVKFNAGILDV